MAQTLYAAFPTVADAEKAAGALLDYGVRKEDVSVVAAHAGTDAPVYADDLKTSTDDELHTDKAAKHGISTTTAGDAEAGAAKGTGIGLGLGVLAAIASLVVPGFGLVLGGGALATAIGGLVGATAAGAVAGGVTGYLKDQGVPDEVVTRYHDAVQQGGAFLAISVPSDKVDAVTAEGIIAKYGASDVNTY